MSGGFFDNSLGDPVDPSYIRFRDGLKGHLSGADMPGRMRWHPKDGKWYSYPLSGYTLSEIGVQATRPPSQFNIEHLGGLTFESVPKMPNSYELPQIYRDVAAAYERIKHRWPHAVWSARTGEWRGAASGATPSTPPGSTKPGLPQAMHERIAGVDEAERLGYITRDDAARLKESIVGEYT
ncbi:hypothetical protein [Streptomyces erythrochromogenes]|uniref:hypothetical protein n=1 Tax=Streptomyces erythrochromogenes TaxID=285574 RepID=UPI00367E943A